ncbi:hypothetical protein AKO1_010712 [Acrasis kona]|uniref:ubiquitinyl hydrolase 1 n=1 Tax=Acrasis kona TaxID=1008807 RepID=A0AAW2ZI84_9EUKA
MNECFTYLYKSPIKEQEYLGWVTNAGQNNQPSVASLDGINLLDQVQRRQVFNFLTKNTFAINFWLSNAVFRTESKQFEKKMVSSGWDLAKLKPPGHSTIGFSGTNDTQLLLPTSIKQNDLHQLLSTNAENVYNLLQHEGYIKLPPNVRATELLDNIQEKILLDVGALMLELDNASVAEYWLRISNSDQVLAAVYFDKYDQAVVRSRSGIIESLSTSPYLKQLDKCVIYLDDAHCRGIDLKFPPNATAAVTLGKGITKDKFVQGCMRMRGLGHGQNVTFYASNEVHHQISTMSDEFTTKAVILWVYSNTIKSIKDGFMQFAMQGIGYHRRRDLWEKISDGASLTDLASWSEKYTEPSAPTLQQLYGQERVNEKVPIIIQKQFYRQAESVLDRNTFEKLSHPVVDHCVTYVSDMSRFAHLLDEEQERELDQDEEEEQKTVRPNAVTPHDPEVDPRLITLVVGGTTTGIPAFDTLSVDMKDTLFEKKFESRGWSPKIMCSSGFTRVVDKTKSKNSSGYLRPIRYVVKVCDNDCDEIKYLVLISAHEANHLLFHFKNKNIQLQMFLPRIRPKQRILINEPCLNRPHGDPYLKISSELLVQLFMLSGTLYYDKDSDEREKVCDFLGYCPKPRTPEQEEAFEKRLINSSGFIPVRSRGLLNSGCKFKKDPSPFFIEHHAARTRNLGYSDSDLDKILMSGQSEVDGAKNNDETNGGLFVCIDDEDGDTVPFGPAYSFEGLKVMVQEVFGGEIEKFKVPGKPVTIIKNERTFQIVLTRNKQELVRVEVIKIAE